MRYRNTYIAFACLSFAAGVGVLAGGCQKRQIEPQPRPGLETPQTGVEVVLSGKVSQLGQVSKQVEGTAFEVGDTVGVYMYRSNQSIGRGADVRSNVPYVQEAFQVLDVAQGSQPILYPSLAGTKVNFVAYYPYRRGVTDEVSLDLADQQDGGGGGQEGEGFDLLYSNNAKNITVSATDGEQGEVELQFRHMVAKVNVKIVFDGSFSDPVSLEDIEGPITFTATGLRTRMTMRMADGAVVGSLPGAIQMQMLSGGEVTATANVIPGVALSGLRLTIPLTGYAAHPYTYVAEPSNATFQAGRVYTYTVTLREGGEAVIGAATIDPWEDGNTGGQVIEGETH